MPEATEWQRIRNQIDSVMICALKSGLASEASGLQVNLEIALGGVSAKVKPLTGFLVRQKLRWDVG
jgi:hypothetical protein